MMRTLKIEGLGDTECSRNVAYISITKANVLALWSLYAGVMPSNSLGITRRNLQVLSETSFEKEEF